MFNPYFLLGGLAVVLSAYFGGMYQGYEKEHAKFVAFQEQLKIEAVKQEAKNESVVKQHELVNDGIRTSYDARIAAVRNAYAPSLQHPSSSGSNVSPIPVPSARVIKIAADPEFVGQCAETTAQLVSLQEWITKQTNIK